MEVQEERKVEAGSNQSFGSLTMLTARMIVRNVKLSATTLCINWISTQGSKCLRSFAIAIKVRVIVQRDPEHDH